VTSSEIWTWVVQAALAGGTAIGGLLLLPTKLGDKLLGFHFDRKLSDLKDAQQREVERLKEKIGHFADRGKHSNEIPSRRPDVGRIRGGRRRYARRSRAIPSTSRSKSNV
jgi:hypothetical protein